MRLWSTVFMSTLLQLHYITSAHIIWIWSIQYDLLFFSVCHYNFFYCNIVACSCCQGSFMHTIHIFLYEGQSYNAAHLNNVYLGIFRALSIPYLSGIYLFQHAILENFYTFAGKVEDRNSREVLLRLVSLFGAWSLEKHLATLYMVSSYLIFI